MEDYSISNYTGMALNPKPWFDEQFSVSDLKVSIENEETNADSVLQKAQKALEKAYGKDNSEDFEYVVDLSAEQKHAISVGDIKLDFSRDGDTFAQIRNADGSYGEKLPIKKQLAEEGITPEALLLALQMEALKEQLNMMMDTLAEIETSVHDVLAGQRNDRRGLYFSGLTQFLEAKTVKDEYLRKLMLAQAIKTLNDANAQEIQDVRNSIQFLSTEQYKKSKKITDKIEEHLDIIRQGHAVIFKAACTKASIYQESKELMAMSTAFSEYGYYIEKMIKPNAGLLTELDKKNQFIEKGAWGRLSSTLNNCNAICEQIGSASTFFLTQKEPKNA